MFMKQKSFDDKNLGKQWINDSCEVLTSKLVQNNGLGEKLQ